ncbi:MAG: shikimate dehydrogenase family protein [Coriobacteriales bacterium]
MDEKFNAGVIGYPVDHSLSPKIHNAVYQGLGIPWRYGKFSARTSEDVAEVVGRAREICSAGEGGFIGFNVTTPHKILASQLSDRANPSAYIVGGANVMTFSNSDGKLVVSCDTTDGEGACRALENSGAPIEGSRVLICGTGAAALSIMVSAMMRGARTVRVATRSPERAGRKISGILDRAQSASSAGMLENWGFGEDRRPVSWKPCPASDVVVDYVTAVASLGSFDIVVNGTPLGMNAGDGSPLEGAVFREGQTVMDCVYAHGATKIVEDALSGGARVMDGLSMLVEQALMTIAIWMESAGRPFSPGDPQLYGLLRGAGIDVPNSGASDSGDA